MSKYKWIAQDKDGNIFKFPNIEPIAEGSIYVNKSGYIAAKKIISAEANPNWKDTLINLETEDYEIVDGILKRLPRKTELDKLIDRVKLIDKKAAKWINKNRHKCYDINNAAHLMPNWNYCKWGKYYWIDISRKLRYQQTAPKKTIRYRVSLHKENGEYYPQAAHNDFYEQVYGSASTFVKWLTDWIEVEVNDE